MSAQSRLVAVAGHIAPNTGTTTPDRLEHVLAKNPDDIVITCALRTPVTKAPTGKFKDTPFEVLMAHILTAIREKSGIDPNLVEDICLGNVLSTRPGYGARAALMAAGFPVTTGVSVASRFCSSGLLSIQTIASAIAIGAIDVGITLGIESMSTSPTGTAPVVSDVVLEKQVSRDNLEPMGWTSENVSRDFHVSREDQDRFAVYSQTQAEKADKEGWFKDEIIPVTTKWVDPKTKETKTIIVDKDELIRYGTTYDALAKIKPAFPHWGLTTTGGNASKIADAGSGLLMMKRSTAQRLGQKIIGKYVKSTVVGMEPRIMGISPIYAIPKVLEKAGLTKDDVNLFEINEAFASMYVYTVKHLGLDPYKVNVRGGAIAIGHPLACTGVRQVVTALSELRRRDEKIAVTSMCVGTGMGMAGIFVNEA
ncbi:acetyl-CoA acyltransferase [Exophiala aquamarina CBS 119918]|uniref:acetyl-CoA C-acyltransferase n=1 Tax=Exophiala aquamarina CBS 119918 TaxID=1182545 RepID=A0A072NTL0_9EURO|nr:acetyl-CoA acyltransferase [Exophiala aquamarina CBS 119918]KEF51204.1 acetyl-CoA acyltransferase [Exophiala aquamarina CBS 119918]